ncbi:MAG: hypothetical protein H7288_16695 [Kineosporiaceae bacterium]|nr:hypothetical protein [Aeromicrobium sp.]
MNSPSTASSKPSLFDQPKAVYAVAFACVISFMGIGLVDPILPAPKTQLTATESQVTLLFTSIWSSPPAQCSSLGNISWRGPFYGVSVLMAVALVAMLFLLPDTPKPEHKSSLSAPLKALTHRGLLTMSIAALLYNWGFFTMLG